MGMQRFRRTSPITKDWLEDQTEKIPISGCWLWTRATADGYGRVRVGDKLWLAHRFSWILFKGDIPDRLLVLHKCDNPVCINPEHLYLGNHSDNMEDRLVRGDDDNFNRNITSCPKGHPYSGDNLYITGGKRYCRTCKADWLRHKRALQKIINLG